MTQGKLPRCIKAHKCKGAHVSYPYPSMYPSVWTLPVKDKDERKRIQTELDIKQLIVLKKYPVKIILYFATRINNKVVEVAEPNFIIGMDEEVFADFFPHTFAHLVFKKLLDDGKARQWISYEDFVSKLPKLVKSYINVVPSLSYRKPYVSFMDRSGIFETRRRLAQYLRVVEAYEEKLSDEEAKV